MFLASPPTPYCLPSARPAPTLCPPMHATAAVQESEPGCTVAAVLRDARGGRQGGDRRSRSRCRRRRRGRLLCHPRRIRAAPCGRRRGPCRWCWCRFPQHPWGGTGACEAGGGAGRWGWPTVVEAANKGQTGWPYGYRADATCCLSSISGLCQRACQQLVFAALDARRLSSRRVKLQLDLFKLPRLVHEFGRQC
jgi:hypothetical protein